MFVYPVNIFTERSKPNQSKNVTKNVNPNNLPDTETAAFFWRMPHSFISFSGMPLHIVDGHNHLTNMDHFIRAISKDFDTELHVVETNPKDRNIKQLKSLEEELKKLNSMPNIKDEYVAVPALACVAILNIQDQYNRVMNDNMQYTPENLKANKHKLLDFLKKIYEEPERYKNIIGYMDSNGQGIEYTYGVIKQINDLVSKGTKVYIPSGHPQDLTLKYFAKERGINEELYHLIATGVDIDGKVRKLHEEIKAKNWYEFNLLSLSEANVVGVKNAKGAQDYMFAAYDSCITDGARGVYGFTPIREDGQVIGYSYTDTETNEYPYDEFPANDEIENIVAFVGKQYDEVLATQKETEKLKEIIKTGRGNISECADKIYPVEQLFTPEEIKEKKIDLKGDYCDKTMTLFFRKNNKGEVIFPKCDCEGSGKPSVLSMWGSCFAVFNAIARDYTLIKIDKADDILPMLKLIKEGKEYLEQGLDEKAEKSFYYANQKFKVNKDKDNSVYKENFIPYFFLGQIHLSRGDFEKAKACYNNGINVLATYLKTNSKVKELLGGDFSIRKSKQMYKEYADSKYASMEYDIMKKKYDALSEEEKEKTQMPACPAGYNQYKKLESQAEPYRLVLTLAKMYERQSFICGQTGEYNHQQRCKLAAEDIKYGTSKGETILSRRSEKIHYIGDLYSEVIPD